MSSYQKSHRYEPAKGDVFISFASEDRSIALNFAKILEKRFGLKCWHMGLIGPGRDFRETIQSELEGCIAGIVIWSSHSIKKNTIIEEAAFLLKSKKYYPILIENVDLPYTFQSYQTRKTEVDRVISNEDVQFFASSIIGTRTNLQAGEESSGIQVFLGLILQGLRKHVLYVLVAAISCFLTVFFTEHYSDLHETKITSAIEDWKITELQKTEKMPIKNSFAFMKWLQENKHLRVGSVTYQVVELVKSDMKAGLVEVGECLSMTIGIKNVADSWSDERRFLDYYRPNSKVRSSGETSVDIYNDVKSIFKRKDVERCGSFQIELGKLVKNAN